MKKTWKAIGVVILIIAVLGGLCVGVGLLTGADATRIYSVLDARFDISATIELYSQYIDELGDLWASV